MPRETRESRRLLCHHKILCQFGSQLLRFASRRSGALDDRHPPGRIRPSPPIRSTCWSGRSRTMAGPSSGPGGTSSTSRSPASWSDHHFSFSWRDDLQSLHLSCAFDMRITEGVRRQNVADLLMYVNARLWIGHFDLWPEDGTIVFRHAMIFPDARSQRLAMRGAAQSRAGSLRALLPGLPVRAVGRQDRRGSRRRRGAGVRRAGVTKPGRHPSRSAPGRMGGALLKGWIARRHRSRHRGRAQAVGRTARRSAQEEQHRAVRRASTASTRYALAPASSR